VGSGIPGRAIGQRVGRSHRTVWDYVEVLRRPATPARKRSLLRLSLAEREGISRGLAAGESLRVIAGRLGRAPSTISREVQANGGRRRYRAVVADGAEWRRALRPKPSKPVGDVRKVLCGRRGLHGDASRLVQAKLIGA
jgi:IS30 family transposase